MTDEITMGQQLDRLATRLARVETSLQRTLLAQGAAPTPALPVVQFRGEPPAQAHGTYAGYDLTAADDKFLPVGGRVLVPTGTWASIPAGVYGMMCSRSGLAIKEGIVVGNAPGIIDAGYEGELLVTLMNLGQQPYHIEKGQRVAQLVLARCDGVAVQGAAAPDPTRVRGTGGHGSSGN